MKTMTMTVTCLFAAALTGASVIASTQTAVPDDEPVLFRPFGEFRARDLRIPVEGLSAEPPENDYHASFWANAKCSATLVGEEVLLSAGHCFDRYRSRVSIEVGFAGYDGICRSASDITNGQNKADFAICLMDKVSIRQLETVNFAPAAVRIDDEVLLTGFGGNSLLAAGTYLIGSTKVTNVQGSVVTTKDGAWLHEGDSGGAGFSPVHDAHRRLVSVNAQVETNLRTSFVTLLHAVKAAVVTWQEGQRHQGHAVLICGLDAEAPNCHP